MEPASTVNGQRSTVAGRTRGGRATDGATSAGSEAGQASKRLHGAAGEAAGEFDEAAGRSVERRVQKRARRAGWSRARVRRARTEAPLPVHALQPHHHQQRPCHLLALALALLRRRRAGAGRGRCVSVLLDANRGHIGKSQSKQPAKTDATAGAPGRRAEQRSEGRDGLGRRGLQRDVVGDHRGARGDGAAVFGAAGPHLLRHPQRRGGSLQPAGLVVGVALPASVASQYFSTKTGVA
jgi:hypothetical protein